MNLLLAVLPIAGIIVLYFGVIRPRGAHILKTYQEGGISAVLWNFQTWVVSLLGSVVYALPELLTVVSGHDLKDMLPEPWGAWVALAVAVAIPLLRAFATTPNGQPPSGEA